MSQFVDIAAIHFQVPETGSEGKEAAYRQFESAARMLDGTGMDLVVTCEGMESKAQSIEEAEELNQPGELYSLYRDFAIRNHCTVAGSIKLKKAGLIYNSLLFIGPDGEYLGDYAKTFPTQGEIRSGITPGNGARIVETPAGRLGGVICYDLNFDELRDEYARLKPDILCFSSMFHGSHLQQNWAYRCRSYFAAACKDFVSNIIDPLGRVLNENCFHGRIARSTVNLDRFVMHQDGNTDQFPAIRRKYGKEVIIDYSSTLGTAVLYSQSPEHSATDIANEFGLISLDDLLAESRKPENHPCFTKSFIRASKIK